MKHSTEIKTDLDALIERRDQLAKERDKAQNANAVAQQRLIDTGADDAMIEAAEKYAGYSSLRDTVAELDAMIETQTAEFEAAEVYESKAADRERIAQCEQEIAEIEDSYKAKRLAAARAWDEILPQAYAELQQREALLFEIATLRGDRAAKETVRRRIDGLPELGLFGPLVDQGLQYCANVQRRGTREDRKALVRARNESNAAAEAARLKQRDDQRREALERQERHGWMPLAS